MDYSRTNERLAIELREKINIIRDVNLKWKDDEEVTEMLEEIESVGYFYDEDSWDVYANDDEYYDETPLDLYINDDDNDDEDFDYSNTGRSWVEDEDDYY